MKKRKLLIWIVLVISTLAFLYPDFMQLCLRMEAERNMDNSETLYDEMVIYNEELRKNGQELLDCWSYEQTAIFENESEDVDYNRSEQDTGHIIGEIRIPAIELELPLYLGASNENMAKGAAVLSETSMPVGGESSNCVIAGHRGYGGLPYFRRIDELVPGDMVEIENAKEILGYVVESTQIILPTDLSCLEIQKGRDMLTLISCHPYMGNGLFRYIVYCERNIPVVKETEEVTEVTEVTEQKTIDNQESKEKILKELKREDEISVLARFEDTIRRSLYGVFGAVWIVLIIDSLRIWIRTKKRRKNE